MVVRGQPRAGRLPPLGHAVGIRQRIARPGHGPSPQRPAPSARSPVARSPPVARPRSADSRAAGWRHRARCPNPLRTRENSSRSIDCCARRGRTACRLPPNGRPAPATSRRRVVARCAAMGTTTAPPSRHCGWHRETQGNRSAAPPRAASARPEPEPGAMRSMNPAALSSSTRRLRPASGVSTASTVCVPSACSPEKLACNTRDMMRSRSAIRSRASAAATSASTPCTTASCRASASARPASAPGRPCMSR